jgi:hypothetical protein
LVALFLQAGLDLDGDGVDDGVGGNNAASGGGGGGGPGNKKKNKAQDRRSETNLLNSSSMTAARASPLQLTWEYATTWLNLVSETKKSEGGCRDLGLQSIAVREIWCSRASQHEDSINFMLSMVFRLT